MLGLATLVRRGRGYPAGGHAMGLHQVLPHDRYWTARIESEASAGNGEVQETDTANKPPL